MTREKAEELLNRYPKFFKDGKPPSTGFQCRDGWFNLLDNLLGCMYYYCEMKEMSNYEGIDDGKALINGEKVFPYVTYIKEKFGHLSVMTNSGDSHLMGMIQFAGYLSVRTCEFCGTQRNVGQTKGAWIYTCCELCHEKNERAKDLEWLPNS